ncbi:hypothetical protein P0E69_06860 [Chimaeribacter arupi]|uniref:hypothetical protein n=1 Tax=Chimaeribacter arupi TaxID=2060066 RepID=UPI000C7DE463|nr:hypothetical protein [Chimaeribacter arupi]PLR52411.1 hypothetical protein CYR52_07585 [Chimaeribacter arupi]WKZ93609.1 hypothetical protein P0E69_06860 [Chimaeribacter arupi]
MAITACKILQANDYGAMNQQLTSALATGWKPMGYLRITSGEQQDFYQMVYQGSNLDVDGYESVIANNQQLTVKNSAGTVSATGTVSISQSSVTAVSLPDSTAIVSNTQVLSIPVTTGLALSLGTATRKITLTVSGGIVTAASITS